MLSTGVPAQIASSFADPVKCAAPRAPSFADVVAAVSPAVVSVRVQSETQQVSDNSNFSFNFGGRGFEDLPDDHPLKRFFREFGGPQFRGGPNDDHAERSPRGHPDRPKHLRPTSHGSGFFISEDGYLVTNNHEIADGAAFTVGLQNGPELTRKRGVS